MGYLWTSVARLNAATMSPISAVKQSLDGSRVTGLDDTDLRGGGMGWDIVEEDMGIILDEELRAIK